MLFHEKLNEYISKLKCLAKDLGKAGDISSATLSRYRSGNRIPDINSKAFENLCTAITQIAKQKNIADITKDSVKMSFLQCDDFVSIDNEQLRQNFSTLVSVLNLNMTKLCQHTNYDTSSVFRFRTGARHPAEPDRFASAVALYVSREISTEKNIKILAELIGCPPKDLIDSSLRFEKIKNWMLEGQTTKTLISDTDISISKFLNKLDEFDLNSYIRAIHFNEIKIPTVPFQLPTSKNYYGLNEMMKSELDFLKATIISKSTKPVTMYSDMPMIEMAKDPEFPKKWMLGIAMMLKKGLHLNNIHNIDRPFEEMMLGLESWIPMYMTGQISPYYLKGVQNSVFHHFLKVSGAAALSGEAILGFHSDGRYYLSKTKEDITYYNKRAEELLKNAHPLMDIYREESIRKLNAFLLSDSNITGKRRNILSAPPIYTMDESYLKHILKENDISDSDTQRIMDFAAFQKDITERILSSEVMEDSVPYISKKEFDIYPMALSLSGMFYEKNIYYKYEDYLLHLEQTEKYSKNHSNYILNKVSAPTFRNLQIHIHEEKWAMISKSNSPAIHFVIYHPKLCNAIENFIPQIVES